MACRKAAYRALTEVSEWKQKQDEKDAAARAALEADMRKIWMLSSSASDGTNSGDFCLLWLKDGIEKGPQCGCSGVCGKDHPRIHLTFSRNEKTAQASLSHALVPFTTYFEGLCRQGLATKLTATVFSLKGYLQFHVEKVKKASFGFHLVKVSQLDLSLSKRAHEQQLKEAEENTRLLKKRKRTHESPIEGSLVDQVLEVLYQAGWLSCEYLDLADLAWMRLTSKAMHRMATQLISLKMSTINLSYSVLVNGHLNPETTQPGEGRLVWKAPSQVAQYQVLTAHRPLMPQTRNADEGTQDGEASVMIDQWCPTVATPPLAFTNEPADKATNLGQLVRVYLDRPSQEASQHKLFKQENSILFPKVASPPLELARHQIPEQHPGLDEASNGCQSQFSIDKKLAYTIEKIPDQAGSPAVGCSSICIKSIQFGFGDILGVFVRKKLRQAKQDMGSRSRSRPVTPSERNYVRALAKAARQAPGRTVDFEGLQGW